MDNKTRQIGAVSVSIIVVIGFFAILGLLVTRVVAANPLLDGVVGALTVAFGNVVYFWTGSTSGSQAKDQHIADMMKATASTS